MSKGGIVVWALLFTENLDAHILWIYLPRQGYRRQVPHADQHDRSLVYIIRSIARILTSWLTKKDVMPLWTIDELMDFLHLIQRSVQTSAVNYIQKINPHNVVPGGQSRDTSFNFCPIVGEGDDILGPKIKLFCRASVEYEHNQYRSLLNCWMISN